LRILYFSRDYTPHDHRFLSALAETEHQTSYLRLEKNIVVYETRPLPEKIKPIAWHGGRSIVRWYDGLELRKDLKRILHAIRPELVLAGPLQRSAFLVALAGYKPLVSMSWGYDLIYDAQRNALWSWMTRYTLNKSAAMVGDCNTIHNLAVGYGMPEERIVTFPWGVDLEKYSPKGDTSQAKKNQGHFTLLSTRGWEPIYGTKLVAEAFIKVATTQPDIRLVMLGSGSQEAEIKQLFQQAGVVNRVSTPGIINQIDLPRYYHEADLYICASHSDGSSISLLEAMASGIPALVSDIPGNTEWVTSGENGWLFPDGDVDALAQKILRAADMRKDLTQMGVRARKLAETRADWKKNFPKLLAAFELARQSI
jgi:glycosyltransferase involved in cell wall biosynthesis